MILLKLKKHVTVEAYKNFKLRYVKSGPRSRVCCSQVLFNRIVPLIRRILYDYIITISISVLSRLH
ncbi:hypothetical protein Tsubulata_042201 [Turnera subulata]|uniref:Uncharacterized protein n=1 Tax=Turnera subulata TaxID=218843 RepID=A0A9Q0FPK5_9ROSI|nr:hypothetical protein Tsubulata_042201 [Turnera subulata]